MKARKMLIISATKGHFFTLLGCQINLIDVNFHLQNFLEIFDKSSADKFWSKKDRGWKLESALTHAN